MTRRRYLSTWLQRRVAGEGPLSAVPPLPRELVVRGLGRAFLCLSVWAARFSIYLSICLSVHIKTPGGSISV